MINTTIIVINIIFILWFAFMSYITFKRSYKCYKAKDYGWCITFFIVGVLNLALVVMNLMRI